MLETDVLIVGSGPAGSSTGLMLSSYGVRNIIITKYRWLADTPRAHYVAQRTMEIMTDLGIDHEVKAKAAPKEVLGNVVFCTAIAGEELGRIPYGGNSPERANDYLKASPCEQSDLPQNLFEPILLSNAATRGSHVRFDTEYLSHTQDEDGVIVTVLDRPRNEHYQIRCKYLIGADGATSKVVKDLQLPMAGEMGKSGSISIIFKADLTRYMAHRPGYLWWVLQPGAEIGGLGLGLVRMVRPWNEWQIVWGYDISKEPPQLTREQAVDICRQLIGDAELDIEITSTSLWTVNEMYATEYSRGRVFCMGDAVHRHPPTNGLGSNTSIQDAYNIAWKLAMVIKGQAGQALLDTYSQERAPVGKRIVTRANKSVQDFAAIFQALGLSEGHSVEDMRQGIASLRLPTAEGRAVRQKFQQALDNKVYEFAALGVELNVHYSSDAIIGAPSSTVTYDKDEDLFYQPSCAPGNRLPHAWLNYKGTQVSTLSLVGKGQFTLLCAIDSSAWQQAAEIARTELRIPLSHVSIGPGCDAQDLYGAWTKLWNAADTACLLIRPDGYVAWASDDDKVANTRLLTVMRSLLCQA